MVPRHLVKAVYGRTEAEELRRIKDIDVYGTLILTRSRLEKYRNEGLKLRIENYGKLVMEEDVSGELFEEAALSINSCGVVHAAPHLHLLISDRTESSTGAIKDLAE